MTLFWAYFFVLVGLVKMAGAPVGSGADPCCCGVCFEAYGATILLDLSGLVSCGCETSSFLVPFDYIMSIVSGVAGAGIVLTWDGSSQWVNANIGTVSTTSYSSSDGSCAGGAFETESVVAVSLTCDEGTGLFDLSITTSVAGVPFVIFSANNFAFGDVAPNERICGAGDPFSGGNASLRL